ncbi:MAG: hypothetical protein IPJ41_00935 [Phycisphaerales bacterium]|nr:hypothetical protein [Phycisphaerales bacterium]
MGGFVFIGLISMALPIVGIVLIVWAIVTVWRAVSLPRRVAREPVCEQCKYPVANLAGFTCPECGHDLRHVGITTPRMEASRRGSTATAILAWTFLCLCACYVIGTVSMLFVGASQAFTAAASTTTWQQSLRPSGGAYQSLVLTYDSDFQSIQTPINLTLTLQDGSEHELSIDPGLRKVRGLQDGESDFGDDTLVTWYGEAGLDTADPQIAAAAREAGRVVDLTMLSPGSAFNTNLAQHTSQFVPLGGFSASQSASGMVTTGLAVLAGLLVILVVYIVGIVWIVRRRKRLLGTPA